MTLKEIAAQVKACSKCPLRQEATQPVPGIGRKDSKYILIGEAPGREEDKAGVPFVGTAGKRLNKLMGLARIDQNDCYFTNVVKCRPPKNRDPRKAEIRSCAKWLEQEIQEIKPEYIITLGRVPLNLFSSYGIRQLHGTMFQYEIPEEKTNGR